MTVEGDTPAVKKRPGRKFAGYLEGRGGGDITRTPTATLKEWAAEFAALRGAVDELEAYVAELESALLAGSRVLERTQPVGMWRRILLRWWRLYGGGRRTPLLVREVKADAAGRVGLEPYRPGARQRVDGGFGLCSDLVAESIPQIRMLIAMRAEVVDQVAELKRVAGRKVRSRVPMVGRVREQMLMRRAAAEERLAQVGYPVRGEGETGAGGGGSA